MDTRGTILGVVVPAVFTLVGWILDARLMPLALAGGLAAGLLWPMGMAARGLAITGGVVVLGIAFIAATGPAGILVLFVMLVGWGFVALLAGGLYLLFKRPRFDPHYAARWASREDTLEMVMWEEGRHPGEGVALGVHYGELVG
jgi:hypothetical protein